MTTEALSEKKKQLIGLVNYIRTNIDKLLIAKEIQPEEENYFKWVHDNPTYDENGELHPGRGSGITITKKTWWRIVIAISNMITKTDTFKDTLTYFKSNNIIKENSDILEYFIRKIIYQYIINPSTLLNDSNHLIDNFISELEGKELRCYANVELEGVTIIPEHIDITTDISLRRTKIEDVDKEIPMYPPFNTHQFPFVPSSVLHIQLYTKDMNGIQVFSAKVICLLRLFKVGSVLGNTISRESDYMMPFFGGTITSGNTQFAFDKYAIFTEDVPRLKEFFKTFLEIIPRNLYWPHDTIPNEIAISYQRYCTSLLDTGIIEKKIADVMAGLESIFLTENIEVSYKLKVRVCRFFYYLGMDAKKVKSHIGQGYKIRSTYAHGSVLSKEDREKCSHENLFKELGNYLRISIALSILTQMNKIEFIKELEDSLIDKKVEEEFIAKISKWRYLVL